MANYNVDIAVAVKNTQAVTQLSNSINQTGTRVDRLNEILEKFGDNIGGTLVNSVRSFSNATREAALNLNKVALGSKDAAKAAREFVQAVDLENAALKEQAALIAQVRNQGKSGTLRPAQQYSGPIGPGPASSTALSSPLPARSARTTQYLSPVGPVSPQERTGRVEQLARETALRSAANQKDFDARRTFQTELFNIEKRFENSLERQRREADSDEFDRLLKRLNTEQSKIKEVGDLRAKINQKEIEDFDKRFKQARDLRGQTSPIGGAVGIPGSPAAKAAAAKKGGGNKLSDLALGVGFPLLFGGGAGSIAGGALGSVGGMGGQVLGSAIGGIVDQAVGSIAELGQALNPLTADIGAITAAAGESGTAFERLVKDLEELAGTEKALEVATAQLTTVIGQDGVSALKQFGEESAELGRLYGETLSQISAAVAGLINSSGLLTAFANQLEKVSLVNLARSNATKDPELTDLNQELTRAEFGKGDRSINVITEELVARQKELQIAEQLKIVEEARAEIVKQKAADAAFTNNILRAEIALAESGLDLTTETGLELAKKLIQQKFLAENQKELNEGLSGETSELVKQLALINLKNKAKEDREAKDRKERREAEAAQRKAAREQEARDRKAKQLQQSIFNEDLKQLQIQSKINQFYQGDIEAIQTQKQELELVLNARVDQVRLTTEDLTLQNEKIETLKMQASLELASLDRSKEQLLLAEQISALSAAAGFDVLGLAGNTNAVQDRGIYGADTGPVSFEEGIDLAPLIAYQVELDKILEKYPLIGEAAGAAAGLITTGFESIIDGTKSAEEVFADFLNNIADMLMKTAQQMIAQYIAIAIAKMFAGMGTSFSGGSFSDFNGVGGNPFTTPSSISPFEGFADGGRPPVGRPSIVGERGPELFVPGASGTIIPNHAMGGANVTVNVDASGTKAEGNGQGAKQLGSAIGAAVQAELIKQQRPGGLLAS